MENKEKVNRIIEEGLMESLWDCGFKTIQELETEQGILASSKGEIFGCIFGRDSLITAIKLMDIYKKTADSYFLNVSRKILEHLITLQGKAVNIESGEEPGKCIHEFRVDNHSHLTNSKNPWFIYPDNTMRNYDTVDATPLLLIALYKFYTITKDEVFMQKVMPAVRSGLDWVLFYGDANDDGFIDYHFHPKRTYGGLHTQSWMDSQESIFHEDGTNVAYPIAPVEVQAYTYVALKSWAKYFKSTDSQSEDLENKAMYLKRIFREVFVIENKGKWSLASAVDGKGKLLESARSSMGHCLWAMVPGDDRIELDTILSPEDVPNLVKRLMSPDLFEAKAGIRTLSTESSQYDPNSYHNGSIWPHDNSMIIEGLVNFSFETEAEEIRKAILSAYLHFKTPIELFTFCNGGFGEYCSIGGQKACKKQAWSAAALLKEVADKRKSYRLSKTDTV